MLMFNIFRLLTTADPFLACIIARVNSAYNHDIELRERNSNAYPPHTLHQPNDATCSFVTKP